METAARITIPYQDETIEVTIYQPRHTHWGKTYYTVNLEEADHTIERDKNGKWLCKSLGKELGNKIIKEIERLKIV